MGINQKTLPGILLCAILAIPCWLLGLEFHLIGSPIFAIILGIIIGSIFTSWKREKTGAGIGFTSKKILQWAVIGLWLKHYTDFTCRLDFFTCHHFNNRYIFNRVLCYLSPYSYRL